MKEADIRVDDDLDHRWSLYRNDQRRLLEKIDQFVVINCPACQSSSRAPHYIRDGFTFERCRECDTIYVSPRPTTELLIDHYRNSTAEAYFNEHIYPITEEGRVQHLITPRIKAILGFCEHYGVARDTLIDIGAGSGTFSGEILDGKHFARVIGIEPNPVPAKTCATRGVEVIEDFVENVTETGIADVITSFENIEHVFNPQLFLDRVTGLLRPKGLLIITTPNIKGFDLDLLKDKSDNTTAPDHLNYFHPASLRAMLEGRNFEVLEITTPGKLDVELVHKKVLDGTVSFAGIPFLETLFHERYEELAASFQGWLAEHGQSSHMWAVARKLS